MPSRPARAWFRRCVAGVELGGGAVDPRAVCGAAWQRKTPREKRVTLDRYGEKPMRHKHHAVAAVRHAAASAASELAHHGMPHAAHGVRVIGNATAAIGTKVKGWQSHLDGIMRAAPHRKRRKKSSTTKRRKGHKVRHRLTPAQRAAGFGGKRAMHGHRKAARKRKGRKGGKRRRR